MVTDQSIIRAVCAFYKLEPAALLERTKVREIVWPRHELIYMLRTNTRHGWIMIGRLVGGRDQSSVKNSVEQVTARILADNEYADHIGNLSRFVRLSASTPPQEPALAVARRMIGAEAPQREDAARVGLCLLTAASILGNSDLSDAEARQAALVVLGRLADAA